MTEQQGDRGRPNPRATLRRDIQNASTHPAWDALTKAATPAALAISAASYLSGFTYKYVLYGAFGFSPGVIETAVQDTAAIGYVPLAGLLLAIAAGAGVTAAMASIAFAATHRVPVIKRAIIRFAFVAFRPVFYWNLLNWVALLMLAGILAGGISGQLTANRDKENLRSGCRHDCLVILTTRGRVRGIVLGQSKDSSLVVSRRAAYLLPNSSLLGLYPAEANREWHPD